MTDFKLHELLESVVEEDGVIKAERVFRFFRVAEDPGIRSARKLVEVLADQYGVKDRIE